MLDRARHHPQTIPCAYMRQLALRETHTSRPNGLGAIAELACQRSIVRPYSYPTSDGDITLQLPVKPTVTPRMLDPSIKSARCYVGDYEARSKIERAYVFEALVVDCPAYNLAAESDAMFAKVAGMVRGGYKTAPPYGPDDQMRDIPGQEGRAKEMVGGVGPKRVDTRVFMRTHSCVMIFAAWNADAHPFQPPQKPSWIPSCGRRGRPHHEFF